MAKPKPGAVSSRHVGVKKGAGSRGRADGKAPLMRRVDEQGCWAEILGRKRCGKAGRVGRVVGVGRYQSDGQPREWRAKCRGGGMVLAGAARVAMASGGRRRRRRRWGERATQASARRYLGTLGREALRSTREARRENRRKSEVAEK